MFIAALFTIAKTWKLPKCPSTGNWFKKMCYIYIYTHTVDYYSAIKKNEILPFAASWMDLENIILSKPDKDKYYMISLMVTKVPNGKGKGREGGINKEYGINRYKLLYIK